MTINPSRRHQSEPASPWTWPTIAPILPEGLPQGAFTLIRIPTRLQSTGLAIVDDLVSSVVEAGMRMSVATTDGLRVLGPESGPVSANLFAAVRDMSLNLRRSDVPTFTGGLKPEALGVSVASALLEHARQEATAASVGVWWDGPDENADGFHTLKALIDIAHVVIDVVACDEGGPVLTMSTRARLADPLPYQRLVQRGRGSGE